MAIEIQNRTVWMYKQEQQAYCELVSHRYEGH